MVVSVIAILASLLLPALSKAKASGRTAVCLSNKRQLALAWTIYAMDNDDQVAVNSRSSGVATFIDTDVWASGLMDWTLRSDNTNRSLVADQKFAKLAKYFSRAIPLLECPEDNYLSPEQRAAGWKRRMRSVSMNFFVGQGAGHQPQKQSGPWVIFERLSDIQAHSASGIFIFFDEHPDSISFPCANSGPRADNERAYWNMLPASYHSGGGTFAFVDGHSERKKWLTTIAKQSVTYTSWQDKASNFLDPDLRDVTWVQERMAKNRDLP